MKALTICQPWAWAIVEGLKPVENRSWFTRYRGDVLIHAGLSRRWFTCDTVADVSHAANRLVTPSMEGMHFGVVLGVATLVRCDRLADSPMSNHRFAEGPFCWIFTNIRKCTRPIPCKGAQGLWTPLDQEVTQVMDSIKRVK